ncbi:VOC family protein [Brevibacillus laterosporus]|uniref:VOC family protein n=1 Tax=Brevibacillus laterosporus TaxID=1465 RepID=UPI0034A0B728
MLLPTIATFVVDSLDEFATSFKENGYKFMREPRQVPTGKNMTVQHPDGTIVEYVEHSRG